MRLTKAAPDWLASCSGVGTPATLPARQPQKAHAVLLKTSLFDGASAPPARPGGGGGDAHMACSSHRDLYRSCATFTG